MTYLDDVKRARELERLPVLEQDAAIVTLLHLYPEQRGRLLMLLIQLDPEAVAAALDELEFHGTMSGAEAFYEAAQARYAIYRATSGVEVPA